MSSSPPRSKRLSKWIGYLPCFFFSSTSLPCMVRGRKRDMSAPLTRSLILQRDYRARKAKYISDLEARCQKLENDNSRLSKEVKELKYQLRKKGMDRKDRFALTAEADIEKVSHALNSVIVSLQSAATSIKSFQCLFMADKPDATDDHLTNRKQGLPSPSTTPSINHDSTGLSPQDFRTVHLYSPVSNAPPSPTRLTPSSRDSINKTWNLELVTQGFPSDANLDGPTSSRAHQNSHMRPQSVGSRSNVFPPDPSVDFSSSSSTQYRRVSSSRSFCEHEASATTASASLRERSFDHPIPGYNRLHGLPGHMSPFIMNDVLPQDGHPMAFCSYERTFAESLRNFS
ncbi:hypothetical protein F5050DRAFT_845188 [Lentinula boryana]|uniref:BZIP domain-containing protein n=1 Tax=Lentinula boryana TaxID=40481 RepID=A0ABQ8Q381_9AGAR|nr:hypothetical protein F5050DRAFT_845188 [Lentinula boryana]